MQIFYKDRQGGKLAIDTDARQYCADYMTPPATISDEHEFTTMPESGLYIIAAILEEDGYTYNAELETD